MTDLPESWKNYWHDIVEGHEYLKINITDSDLVKIGELRPMTKKSVNIDSVVESLTNWRAKYSKFFFTNFETSEARTKSWIENSILSSETQMLFLIYCDGKLIGQYGFKDLTVTSAFMDNLIRGVSGGHPKLMERAIIALVAWLFENHDIQSVGGSVLSDNPFAMIVNKAAGFVYLDDMKKILPDGRYSRDIILTRETWNLRKHN